MQCCSLLNSRATHKSTLLKHFRQWWSATRDAVKSSHRSDFRNGVHHHIPIPAQGKDWMVLE